MEFGASLGKGNTSVNKLVYVCVSSGAVLSGRLCVCEQGARHDGGHQGQGRGCRKVHSVL